MIAAATQCRRRVETWQPPSPPSLDEFELTRGTRGDLDALAHLHYRSARCGVIDRILIARRRTHGWQRMKHVVVAAIVRTHPPLGSVARRLAIPELNEGNPSRSAAAQRVSTLVRTISRVVVDPRVRGLGLATALVRAMLRQPATRYTEAFATMGWIHPFFQRAGMAAWDRPVSTERRRALDALEHLTLTTADLSQGRWATRSAAEQRLLRAELMRWARSTCRIDRAAAESWSMEQLCNHAAMTLAIHPVYYLRRHDQYGPEVHAADSTEDAER